MQISNLPKVGDSTEKSPRYTMAQLLAVSDYAQPQPKDQRELVDATAAGGELL